MPDAKVEEARTPPCLARQADAANVEPRLRRFGAERFEPAWLSLWAMAIGRDAQTPLAWLLAADNLPRALLWPGELNFQAAAEAADESDALRLSGGPQPTLSQFERWWLWERLARPRRWPLRTQPATLRPLALPLWLGYSRGRPNPRGSSRTRLIVISGVSGEALGALKPAVLAGLRERARHSGALEAVDPQASTPVPGDAG